MTKQIRTLVIDDDPTVAALTAEFIGHESDQLEPVVLTDPTEALNRLLAGDIDCIVSDFDMPRMNGIELLKRVREHDADIPFVLFTGKGSETVASEAISAGVSDYLQKRRGSERYALLANRITNLVAQRRAQERVRWHDEQQQQGEQQHRRFVEIAYNDTLSDDERRERLLELGCDRLGLDSGYLSVINEETGRYEIVQTWGSADIRRGVVDLSETYCRQTLEADDVLAVYSAPTEGWTDDPAYEKWELPCYIGKRLLVDGELYGTLCFVSEAPRDRPFTAEEKLFVDLLGQAVVNGIRDRQLERRADSLRRMHEVVSDQDQSFVEQVEQLVQLGCESIRADYGALSRVEEGRCLVEAGVGPTDLLTAIDDVALSRTYCERVVATGGTVAAASVADDPALRERPAYTELGLACFLGAPVVVDGRLYGTFCFYSDTPRDRPFSTWERALVDLMSRWISAELERQETTARLEERTERLGEFATIIGDGVGKHLDAAERQLRAVQATDGLDQLDTATRTLKEASASVDRMRRIAETGAAETGAEPTS